MSASAFRTVLAAKPAKNSRGAGAVEEWAADTGEGRPYGMDLGSLARWARELAAEVEAGGGPVDARERAPLLR